MSDVKLKTCVLALALMLGTLPPAHAQSVFFDFKFGAFYPAELPGGLFPNVALHKSIDRDGVWQWDVGVGAGYYRRSNHDLVYVAPVSLGASAPAEEIDFTRKMTPLQIKLTMKISLIEMNLPSFPGTRSLAKSGMSSATSLQDLGFFVRPYAAYFKLTSEEENRVQERSVSRTYEDWGWGAESGIYLSTVNNVAVTISVLYNRATLQREEVEANDTDDAGLPIAKDVKLHGFGFFLSMGWGF
ncbi:hypothetical protein HUU05_17410 [candidate division KSB1 bacterium]|nr:hypothetical protein [candidate division KSB1 bacterium]